MAGFLQAVASWPGAVFLQDHWIAYLVVNAAHILGIALLLGAILPLDLLLLRATHRQHLPILGPFLLRAAATGAVLAVTTGLWLFSVKPVEYAGNPAFLIKIALLALAICNIGFQHRGERFETALRIGQPPIRVRALAATSVILWVSVLLAGRWIGFVW